MFLGAIGVFLRTVSVSSLKYQGRTPNAQNTNAQIDKDQVKFEAKIETKGEK